MCAPKLSCVPKGSGTEVRGLPRFAFIISALGRLSGTLRKPSISSEKQISLVGISLIAAKALRTIVVRATSPNVPICGSPEGP